MSDKFELEKEYDFQAGVRSLRLPKKRSTTIRSDDDLILYFKKKTGEKKVGYQTLVNDALQEYLHDHAVD